MTDQSSPQPPAAPETKEVNWVKEEPQELRVFFFWLTRRIAVPNPSNTDEMVQSFFSPPRFEKMIGWIFEFILEKAAELAKAKYPGFSIVYTGQNPTIREFLAEGRIDDFQKYSVMREVPKEPEIQLIPQQMSFENFKYSLMLVADEYVLKPEDREVLKRIITGLKYRANAN